MALRCELYQASANRMDVIFTSDYAQVTAGTKTLTLLATAGGTTIKRLVDGIQVATGLVVNQKILSILRGFFSPHRRGLMGLPVSQRKDSCQIRRTPLNYTFNCVRSNTWRPIWHWMMR